MRTLAAARVISLALEALAVRAAAAWHKRPRLGFWPEYEGGRRVQLLDGQWRFGMRANLAARGFDSMDAAFDPSSADLTPNLTTVPMAVDVAPPGQPGPRGVGMYRRNFTQRRGPARLQFNACSFYCRVWVDGVEIGEHRAGGYVGFFLDVPSVEKETTRELFVLTDNRFNRTTAPLHTGGDFWHYGGIFRSVLLHDMPAGGPPWPWRAYVLPTQEGYRQGVVNVTVKLTDPGYSGSLFLSLAFDGGRSPLLEAQAVNGTVEFPGFQVPSPRLWSTADPQLHTLTVTGAGGQGVTERFGLRWWGVDEAASRLTLNGRVIKLHGWNHHTEWPGTGPAPTDDQLDSDLTLMRAAGCNYIRGAHYPQDQRWLDRIDEAGIVMWEEALGPGTSVADLTDWDHFMRFQVQQMNEMLDMSLNHASIMAWGWFNEGHDENVEACSGYKANSDVVRGRDPTRFRTWASNRNLNSKCLEHASLIAFNNYPGWYSQEEPAHCWTHLADNVHKKYPGRPFVISETGAGAVYEWAHNTTASKWTQRYQVSVISEDVDTALNDTRISGITLWHFFDFKANDGLTRMCGPCQYLPNVEPPTCSYIDVNCGRPGGENHKGVVDFWRRPKEAYHVVAAKYNASSLGAIGGGSNSEQMAILV